MPGAHAMLDGRRQQVVPEKLKPTLTFVPEREQAINRRLTFVIASANAKEFVRVVMSSELAKAYQPSHYFRSPKDDGDEQMFFCPIDINETGLARIRLQPVCTFAESLPLSNDPLVARTTVIVLLFWRVPKHVGYGEPTDEALKDFAVRVAEIRHSSKQLRPAVVLLAFSPDERQRQQLTAFAEKQKAVVEIPVFYHDAEDNETSVNAVKGLIPEALGMSMRERAWTSQTKAQEKRCCTIQ